MGRSKSLNSLKKGILEFIRLSLNSIFNFHDPKGIKLLSQLRRGLTVNLRIQYEYRKIWTRKNSVFGHFSPNVILENIRSNAVFKIFPTHSAAVEKV